MDCCTRGRALDDGFDDLRGGAAGAGPTPRQQVVFDSVERMESWVEEGGWTCLLLVGNNAAGYTEQAYKDATVSVRQLLESAPTGSRIESAMKAQKLLVVFGGDSLSQKHRNIASVVEFLRSELGLPLLAVACDRVAKEWGGVDPHVDYACYYPEQRDPATGQTIWGGVGPDGAPIGGSAYYLARTIGNALGGVIAIAGGEVSAAEVRYVLEREPSAVAPVAFIRAEAAQLYSVNGSPDTDHGPLESLWQAYVAAGRLPRGEPAFATFNKD